MRTKVKWIAAGVLVSFLAAAIFAMPFLTVKNMKAAAEARDAATLSRYIDFPAVRESVKATASAKLAAATGAPRDPNPLSALGSSMAGVFVDRMVDMLITPESIAMMMTGQGPKDTPSDLASSVQADLDMSMGYESPSRFIASVKKKGSTNEPISFVLGRDRLVFWKLVSVRLP